MSAQAKKKLSMTSGNPAKPLILFTLPLVAGNIFQQFYNIVDSIIVGNYVGANALAAVGSSTAITMMFVMIATGTGIGCSVIISQLFGAKQFGKMKSAISTALISVLVFSIILSIIGVFINKGILTLMGTPADVFDDAVVYLQIYFYGFVFLFMYNIFSSVFQALGDSMKPLLFLVFSSVLNIGLDIYFVVGLHMGVAGVAWATLIAQGVSALLSFIVLMHKLKRIETEKYAFFDGQLLKSMIKIAIPSIIQQSIISVGMVFIQAVVNRFGATFLAGYTAATKIDGIAIVPMVAVGNAMSTYVAQNMGAGKPDRVKIGYRICLAMGVGMGVVLAVLFGIFGEQLIGLFMDSSSEAAAIAVGVDFLSVISKGYIIMALLNCTGGILRGAGDMKFFLVGSLSNLALRIILCYSLATITAGDIIRWSGPLGWFLGFLIFFIRYKQGGWKKKKLV